MKIEFYQGSEDMPIHRWMDFSLAMAIESGAGQGVDGLEAMLATAYRHLRAKDFEKVGVILTNSMQNIAFARERVLPLTLAHAAMVRTLNGEDVSTLSAEQVLTKLELAQEKTGKVRQFVEGFAKKFVPNWRYFSPNSAKTR